MEITWPKFSYELLIREFHLDTLGHVNNAAYLQIFEEARWEVVTSNGYGLKEVQKHGIGPVILEAHLVFKKEVGLRRRVTVETQITKYQGKIFEMLQEMKDEEGELLCSAKFVAGLFDLKQRKLILPTQEWTRALGGKA